MKRNSAQTGYGNSRTGYFVLENANGETVRAFHWESPSLFIVYRHDTRRVETLASLRELDQAGVTYDLLGESTPAKVKKAPIEISNRGVVKWVPQIPTFSPNHNLADEVQLEPKFAYGWSAALQVGLAGLITVAGFLSGSSSPKPESATVTLLTPEAVQQIINKEENKAQAVEAPREQLPRQAVHKTVVAPTLHKAVKPVFKPIFKPIARHSSHSTKSTHVVKSSIPHGGGYRSQASRGYGTNEEHMNEIGALGALTSPHRHGGNGGEGGLNLQAVGTEAGSGAGGKGFGGFGNNGGGGHGLGGLGTGHGSGLANAMYGKGLIAAPFGEGSPAPGSGGYGTRGKAGGGAQGAGYGTQTIVGSWKGTGPKGDGPAGSGSGSGDPYGSPYGGNGDDDDAVVSGGLSMDQIRQIIERNIGQVRYCYEQGLQKEPHLSGRVAIRFQIGGGGNVTLAHVKHSSVHSAQVESCIVGKLRGWSFPKPQGGVTVGVVYPFVLNRTVSMR